MARFRDVDAATLEVADAVGVVYQPEGHAVQPGPPSAIISAIAELRKKLRAAWVDRDSWRRRCLESEKRMEEARLSAGEMLRRAEAAEAQLVDLREWHDRAVARRTKDLEAERDAANARADAADDLWRWIEARRELLAAAPPAEDRIATKDGAP